MTLSGLPSILVVGKNTDPSPWTTHVDYPYGLPLDYAAEV